MSSDSKISLPIDDVGSSETGKPATRLQQALARAERAAHQLEKKHAHLLKEARGALHELDLLIEDQQKDSGQKDSGSANG